MAITKSGVFNHGLAKVNVDIDTNIALIFTLYFYFPHINVMLCYVVPKQICFIFSSFVYDTLCVYAYEILCNAST